MNTEVFYSSSTAQGEYSAAAINYISNSFSDGETVLSIAEDYSVSATAIAGAMAREYNRYDLVDAAADTYVLNNPLWGTHQYWLDNYTSVGGDNGYIPSITDKATNGCYNDIGYGNIKMATAIRLIRSYVSQHSGDDPLNLLRAERDYSQHYEFLAADLAVQNNSLTAKLYAVMVGEAEDFFAICLRQ
ncbi:MAG: hypothetical protein R3E63_02255 [Pseudomonadales bacterium]